MLCCSFSRKSYLRCGGACFILGITAILMAEWVMPSMLSQMVRESFIMDSSAKFESVYGNEVTTESDVIIFNFTNAHAVMTSAVPPKPIFEEVKVRLRLKAQNFDYELSDDKAEYSYKTWTFSEYVNPADANLQVILPNSVISETMMAFGGEAILKATYDGIVAQGTVAVAGATTAPMAIYSAGCQIIMPSALMQCLGMAMMYAALYAESTLPLRADGTSQNNMGLYMRRSIDELLNGYTDPLTQQPIPGTYLGYNKYSSLDGLQQALLSGIEAPGMFTSAKKTGRGLSPQARDEWVSFFTFTELNATASNPLWRAINTYYDRHGKVGAARDPSFRIKGAGLRSLTNLISPLSTFPSVLSAGISPKVQASASQATYFDDLSLFREVSYSCGNCVHEMHKGVALLKYAFDDANGWLRTDGNRDESGACATSFTCDYAMSGEFIFPIAPLLPTVMSLPYYGHSAMANVATFKDAVTGQESVYNDAIHRNAFYIEPFTGSPIKSSLMSQYNARGFTSSNFNGVLYLNAATGAFAGANLPDPVPLSMSVIVADLLEVEGTGVVGFILSTGLTISYSTMLFMDLAGTLAVIYGIYCLNKAHALGRQECVTSPSKPKAADPPQAAMTIDIGTKRPPSFTVDA